MCLVGKTSNRYSVKTSERSGDHVKSKAVQLRKSNQFLKEQSVGGNPMVRHEGEWTIPFLPQVGFLWTDCSVPFIFLPLL
jgi:hypothetical protein